jgi:hypothetical protein
MLPPSETETERERECTCARAFVLFQNIVYRKSSLLKWVSQNSQFGSWYSIKCTILFAIFHAKMVNKLMFFIYFVIGGPYKGPVFLRIDLW